eukprot:scaffold10375_cov54-Attheya_sp.AAC.3
MYLYIPLQGDTQSIKTRNIVEDGHHASGPTFDPNIRLGPKLDQKVSIPAVERRYSKEGG